MCSKCENLRQTIARIRGFLVDLTDPSSICLTKADMHAFEEKLAVLVVEHQHALK